ncbi:hypothetical protein DFP81_106164 [Marinomonas pollencensis]|uniref:Uncharacterized protein n=1 Tax=Marinomonas pollencensis TaxID=491954 RepID=A0A3E0DKM5_9GAMM|nr:hypothetical protein DFP81_106164 [Marinomonas pollencensis]
MSQYKDATNTIRAGVRQAPEQENREVIIEASRV